MAIGLHTQDLRKIYSSAPPFAAGGVSAPRGGAPGEKPGRQPKPQIVALDGISLAVEPGEIFGLLGPNGAGKSTTVGVLTTRVRPTSGEAWIGEYEVWKEQAAVKRLIGVVPQRLAIIDHGKVIAVDTPSGLKGSIPRALRLGLCCAQHTPGLLLGLQSLSGVREVRSQDTAGADVYADRGGSLIPEIASLASTTGAELVDVHISEPSLENLFLHHTGRSLRD